MANDESRGFSLVETLIAASIFMVTFGALLQLFTLSARSNVVARLTTYETILARSKIEELRTEGKPSPGGSIDENLEGYSDFLDADGRPGGPGMNSSPVYVRRWAIEPIEAVEGGFVLLVLVGAPNASTHDAVELVSIVTQGG